MKFNANIIFGTNNSSDEEIDNFSEAQTTLSDKRDELVAEVLELNILNVEPKTGIWCVDFGASKHVTGDESLLSKFKVGIKSIRVTTAGG